MAIRYPDSRNQKSIEDGAAFASFVAEQLAQAGISLTLTHSRADQFLYGDSREGYEIKLDARAKDTRRLSIEIAERTAIDRAWVPSGIYADHRATMYIQGNYEAFWIFPVATLRSFYQREMPRIVDDNPPTVRKFYLSFSQAGKIATAKWERNKGYSAQTLLKPPPKLYTADECDEWLVDNGWTITDTAYTSPDGVVYPRDPYIVNRTQRHG